MRFISFAMALLMANAKSNLANQLTSLKSVVQATGEWDTNNMIEVISNRKVELEGALEAKTMSKDEVAGELRYLLQLVRDVEANDKAHAVATLSARKASLVNLSEDSDADADADAGDAEADAGDGDAKDDDEKTPEFFEKAVKAAEDKVKDADTKVADAEKALETAKAADPVVADDVTKAEKDLADAKTAQDRANSVLKAAQEAKKLNDKTGGHGLMITGILALVVIGGGCYCYNRNKEEDKEGGMKEDKKLFKKVFKGKTQKKATKEEIIPTFVVPAEEQI